MEEERKEGGKEEEKKGKGREGGGTGRRRESGRQGREKMPPQTCKCSDVTSPEVQ